MCGPCRSALLEEFVGRPRWVVTIVAADILMIFASMLDLSAPIQS